MSRLLKGLFVAIVFASMCACSGEDALRQSSQVETSLVRFSFFDATIEKLDDLTRAGTRAGEVDASTWKKTFPRLDVAIFPQGNNASDVVYRYHQQSSKDEGFGSLSVRLPLGKYKMVAVASAAEGEVDIASPTLATFPGKAMDMAYVAQDIEVKGGTTTANCILKRSLARFVIASIDRPHKNIGKVVLEFTGKLTNAFNPATGYGIKTEAESSITKTVLQERFDYDKLFRSNFVVFLPEEQGTFKVQAAIYDTNGVVVKNLKFDNVILQHNHQTTYTGPLFTSGSNFDFVFDDKALEKSDYDETFGD